MKFTLGEWARRDGTVLVLNLTIFKDFIAADTWSSTKDSEEFLESVLGGLSKLGFAYESEIVRRKAYVSQVHVKCSRPLSALNPRLAEFANRLSSAVGGTVFDMAAIELWPDQAQALKPANFSFQRKIGEPSSSDRYWSQAAVPTDRHLELLEELEAILS
jgi:hypothetical protein